MFKQLIKSRIEKTYWFQNELKKARINSFVPYIKSTNLGGYNAQFYYASEQAREWYDPVKKHAQLEYQWVADHVKLENQIIVDAGGHHGHYAVFFAGISRDSGHLVTIDPFPLNCSVIEVNLRINNVRNFSIHQCAVTATDGQVQFSGASNGQLVASGGMTVPSRRLPALVPDAQVVKLDVEGAEYLILPAAIPEMKSVHTWIVEFHPQGNPHPDTITDIFLAHGFNLHIVNRDSCTVEPYRKGLPWATHTTVFAVR